MWPALACQMLGHLLEHLAEGIDRDFALVAMQDLHEARHVRALEIVRQIHVHVEIRDRVLLAARPILHLDRMIDVLDADLVDRDLARIGMALHVLHGRGTGLFGGERRRSYGGFLELRSSPNMGPILRNAMISEDCRRRRSPGARRAARQGRPPGGEFRLRRLWFRPARNLPRGPRRPF